MRFLAAIAQFRPEKANLVANLDRIAEIIRQAAHEGAELVVFPEASTSGYFLEGGVLECAMEIEHLEAELHARLKDLPRRIDVALGFYQKLDESLFNAAAYLEASAEQIRTVQVYQKFFLPTYGVFDEERFVSSGNHLAVFESRLGRMALLVCEDIWHSIMPTLCALKGAQVLLVPSASPARGFEGERPGNVERYERLLRGISEEHTVYCVNAALVGFEGGKGFVGMSTVTDGEGHVIARAPMLEEHLLLTEIDLDGLAVARARAPLLSDLRSRWSSILKLADQIE